MSDYDLYDKIVARTLQEFICKGVNGGAAINNYTEREHNKFFIEVGKMASHIMKMSFYVQMGWFSFIAYKLSNWRLMKGVKRYHESKGVKLISVTALTNQIKEEFNLEDDTIFQDIYEEYYNIK